MDIKGSDGYWIDGDAKPSYSRFGWHFGVMSGRFDRLRDIALRPLNEALKVAAEQFVNLVKQIPDEKAEARKRSKADVDKKRKELRKRRK